MTPQQGGAPWTASRTFAAAKSPAARPCSIAMIFTLMLGCGVAFDRPASAAGSFGRITQVSAPFVWSRRKMAQRREVNRGHGEGARRTDGAVEDEA